MGNSYSANRGITLMELLLVSCILALLVVSSAAKLNALYVQIRHNAAATYIEDFLHHARQSAITFDRDVYVNIRPNALCIGASTAPDCNCAILNHCQVNGTQAVAHLDTELFALSAPTGQKLKEYRFSSTLGTAIGSNGTFVLSSPLAQINLVISALGRTRLCVAKGEVLGVSSC